MSSPAKLPMSTPAETQALQAFVRQVERLKRALEAHMRFQMAWSRDWPRTELEAASKEAIKLTREADL